MDLDFTADEEGFRKECRTWLEANVPTDELPSGDTREGFKQHIEWENELFDAGWAAVSWPKQYGGREASLIEWLIFEEEYYRAGAPSRVTQNGIFLLAPTLFEFGTDEQKERILRPMARGDVTWGQAWSEPNAGSDLASLTSTARRVEGGWRLTGQKTWSTRAAFCDMAYGLFRTDPAQTRHRGLSYFMFPLRTKGVTVRGVDRLDGDEGFAEIFLEDVFVPDADIIGEVDQGWRVAMATTGSERGLTLRSPGRFMATASRLIDLYHRHRDRSDPVLRDRVIQAWMDAQAYRWFTFQTVTRMMQGESIGADSSMNKVFWSEMDVRTHETALALIGELLELDEGAESAVDQGQWMKGFQFALAGPIYAGTNEIQRNIIAERVLGLPRK
ncbi:MAG: acyl-CoA dehydrogenase family protein [Myxococcales bacterium]|nr:acyl-CoA dehydrogenase family protein [Myxococcales bacterium]MDH3486100.1 acyl-CoA dehydrogenase family protein [Myxococcales bacterium]